MNSWISVWILNDIQLMWNFTCMISMLRTCNLTETWQNIESSSGVTLHRVILGIT
jgi:hypothetical protein